ncbi:MAG: DMT family transporter [Xanthomonadales bacterium]|nr:DMT family transporter [Xanthomonadales bacterium]
MAAVAQRPLQAIGLMVASVFFMSTMDVLFKLLVEHYSSFQVVFFRCVTSLPYFVVWILLTGHAQFRTAYPRGHLLRGMLGLLMMFAVGECFRELQLADAYTLFFVAPLLVTLLSGPVLGERAGRFRIMASLLGFSGVLVVLKPGGEINTYGALMAMVGVLSYAVTALLLRKLGARDGTVTIAFWFLAISGIGSAVIAIPNWQPVTTGHWPLILLFGLLGAIGQVLLTAAFRRASAAIIAPFDYLHMFWAVIYGLAFWGYLPGPRVWVGSSIIILSGLFILYRENRLRLR